MNKTINKNSIVIGAGVLSVFAFCILFTSPIKAHAFYYVGFVNGNYIGCETDLDSYGKFVGCGHVNKVAPTPAPVVAQTTSKTTKDTSNTTSLDSTTSKTITDKNATKTNSNLGASAVLGSNGFLPNSFLQWLILIVLILLIIVVWRKLNNSKEKFHASPLKHA